MKAGVKPDDKTYNSLMHACGRNGNPKRAELWYAQLGEISRCSRLL